jgi:hypothetical protein
MRHLPTLLQLAGISVVVVVAFALHVIAGGAVLGAALIVVGALLEQPVKED